MASAMTLCSRCSQARDANKPYHDMDKDSPASSSHYRLDPAHRLALLADEKRHVAQFRHDGEEVEIVRKAFSIVVDEAVPFRLVVARTFTAIALMKLQRAETELCASVWFQKKIIKNV